MIRKLIIILSLFAENFIYNIENAVGGDVIAVGGGEDKQFLPIFVKMINDDEATVCILACAKEPEQRQLATIHDYREALQDLGCKNIFAPIILSKETANNIEIAAEIAKSKGILVTGGNQHLLLQRIENTKVHTAILTACKNGATYYGNSAGTAVIGPKCILGRGDEGQILVGNGLGVITDTVFDQHLTQRNRRGRLEETAHKFALKGCGIDEETALIIKEGKYSTVGENNVYWTPTTTNQSN